MTNCIYEKKYTIHSTSVNAHSVITEYVNLKYSGKFSLAKTDVSPIDAITIWRGLYWNIPIIMHINHHPWTLMTKTWSRYENISIHNVDYAADKEIAQSPPHDLEKNVKVTKTWYVLDNVLYKYIPRYENIPSHIVDSKVQTTQNTKWPLVTLIIRSRSPKLYNTLVVDGGGKNSQKKAKFLTK